MTEVNKCHECYMSFILLDSVIKVGEECYPKRLLEECK